MTQLLARLLGEFAVPCADGVQLKLLEILQIEQRVVRTFDRANQLVELEVYSFSIAVLRVLDQEHHEKRDDRGAGVDDELPGIAEAEYRPRDCPRQDHKHGDHETRGPTRHARRPLRETGESRL